MNSWMANPTFDTQMAHILAGYAAVMTAKLFWPKQLVWLWALYVGAAATKEFWYDANYELPKQTFDDNLLDFSMYCVGIVVGMIVASI